MEKIVRSGLVTACRLAGSPTLISPVSVKANGGCGTFAFGVGNYHRFVTFANGHYRVGRSQVYSDDFGSFVCHNFSLFAYMLSMIMPRLFLAGFGLFLPFAPRRKCHFDTIRFRSESSKLTMKILVIFMR